MARRKRAPALCNLRDSADPKVHFTGPSRRWGPDDVSYSAADERAPNVSGSAEMSQRALEPKSEEVALVGGVRWGRRA